MTTLCPRGSQRCTTWGSCVSNVHRAPVVSPSQPRASSQERGAPQPPGDAVWKLNLTDGQAPSPEAEERPLRAPGWTGSTPGPGKTTSVPQLLLVSLSLRPCKTTYFFSGWATKLPPRGGGWDTALSRAGWKTWGVGCRITSLPEPRTHTAVKSHWRALQDARPHEGSRTARLSCCCRDHRASSASSPGLSFSFCDFQTDLAPSFCSYFSVQRETWSCQVPDSNVLLSPVRCFIIQTGTKALFFIT